MAARFKQVDSGLPALKDSGRGILYQCRMQYLKSREGGSRSKTRKKEYEMPQFSCLDERMHVPCSSEILLPPNELMTRSKAFRHAFWRHHKEPTMKTVKRLEFGQDKRNEQLAKKRKEILSRIEATTRESELRRRAERVMNHSLESIEDDSESDSESIIPSVDDGGNLQDDDSVAMNPLSTSSNRRKGARMSMMYGTPKSKRQEEPINKTSLPPLRVTMTSRSNESRGKENADESAFSFLSDWSKKDKQKIRW